VSAFTQPRLVLVVAQLSPCALKVRRRWPLAAVAIAQYVFEISVRARYGAEPSPKQLRTLLSTIEKNSRSLLSALDQLHELAARLSDPTARGRRVTSPFVFVSERGATFSTAGFARMLERAAEVAELKIKVNPHMLRHACGFALANAGHDTRALQAYLGHKNIQHTVRYTELAPTRFKSFWRD
jgi:integrase